MERTVQARPHQIVHPGVDDQETLAPDEPGREILYPVATVIIGGLLSSTLLDFLARPGIFWLFSRKEAERLTRKHEHLDPLSEEIVADFDRSANGKQANGNATGAPAV